MTKSEQAQVRTIVQLLDKTTRVMQTMSMRLDVMAFGQRQLERRVGQLERSALKSRSTTSGSTKRSRRG